MDRTSLEERVRSAWPSVRDIVSYKVKHVSSAEIMPDDTPGGVLCRFVREASVLLGIRSKNKEGE